MDRVTERSNRLKERSILVDNLKSEGYIKSRAVEKAMLRVPRHEFLPKWQKSQAYMDTPLSIGYGQTISAPHMVAIMTENLNLKEDSRVLEIGSGSGYQAAVIAEIAVRGRIYSVERIPELAEFAQSNLSNAGYNSVKVIIGEGTQGYEKESPYDRIIVTAGAPRIPETLTGQLKDRGKLIIPVGGRAYQELKLLEKGPDGITVNDLGGCVFVPLVGKGGW